MKKITALFLMMFAFTVFANNGDELTPEEAQAYLAQLDSINSTFTYHTGNVNLKDKLAVLNLPEGFTYLEGEEGEYVLEKIWGNPHSEIIGLMFPEGNSAISDEFKYAVEITYTEDGYVEDEDAKELDYDDLLKEMQEDAVDGNESRIEQGYPAIELVGWATPPFYDAKNKKLHWAKELKFEGYDTNTLNYNVRVLGRKGYLNLNVIADMSQLEAVNNDIEKIIESVHFSEGYTYKEFNPEIDDIAAYGIGGLIAGKVLAKAGFFVVLLKFWKVIAIAVAGFFGTFKKKIFGSKKEE